MFRAFIAAVAVLSATPVACEAPAGEQFQFQADVNKLMVRAACARLPVLGTCIVACSCAHTWATLRSQDIIINSLYSKKEIFLRELISNGAAAVPAPLRPGLH